MGAPNAARETLRMGDTVEVMLRDVMAALMNNDRALVSKVSRLDNVVDGHCWTCSLPRPVAHDPRRT